MYSNMYAQQQQWRGTGGGTGYTYNPAIGNNPLPGGTQGTVNRAYTHTPQQNELVAHQLQGLLASNSPYIQQARQSGREEAAGRGLLNSSMAAGAAQREAIRGALPIAQADAGRYGQSAESNLGYLNQMAQLQSNLASNESIANRNLQSSMQNASGERAAALQLQRERLAFQGEQQGLDRAHQLGMGQFGLGSDLARMGYGAQWNNWLGDQETTRGMERDLYQTQLGAASGFSNSMNNVMANAFTYGLFNPEFMANPQQMSNLLGGINQMSLPFFNNIFSNLFGGLGGP